MHCSAQFGVVSCIRVLEVRYFVPVYVKGGKNIKAYYDSPKNMNIYGMFIIWESIYLDYVKKKTNQI